MSPAEGLYRILEAKGFFTGGWNPQVGIFSDENNTLAFMDTGGMTPEVLVAIDYPTVQLLGRGNKANNSYSILYEKMKGAKKILHAISQTDSDLITNFPILCSCLVRGEIVPLGQDQNQRPIMSLNFQLITNPTGLEVGNRTA